MSEQQPLRRFSPFCLLCEKTPPPYIAEYVRNHNLLGALMLTLSYLPLEDARLTLGEHLQRRHRIELADGLFAPYGVIYEHHDGSSAIHESVQTIRIK